LAVPHVSYLRSGPFVVQKSRDVAPGGAPAALTLVAEPPFSIIG